MTWQLSLALWQFVLVLWVAFLVGVIVGGWWAGAPR